MFRSKQAGLEVDGVPDMLNGDEPHTGGRGCAPLRQAEEFRSPSRARQECGTHQGWQRPRRLGLRTYGRGRLLREGRRCTVSAGDGTAQRVPVSGALRDVPNLGEGLWWTAPVGGGTAQRVPLGGALRDALHSLAQHEEGFRWSASVGGGTAQRVPFFGSLA